MIEAALRVFADRGYDRATVREIARRARVDPALLYHYFAGKAGLFVAAVQARVQPPDRSQVPAGETLAQTAARLVRTALARWGTDARAVPFVALLRGAMSDPAAATLLRGVLERDLLPHLRARLGPGAAALRMGLVAAQLLGLGTVRYVLRLEPVASLPLEELALLAAPAIARALRASPRGAAPRSARVLSGARS
ncbi:MAG TPA: TetR family transcriptional regulator [Myxococcota bacterium]|jgi:AcrR family transcriptional regulator|nr:TetR family transcriptional regulator [Myxococcota bacterium]